MIKHTWPSLKNTGLTNMEGNYTNGEKFKVTGSWGYIFKESKVNTSYDALPSHGVKPTWGFHKIKLQKVELGSTLPASNSRKG